MCGIIGILSQENVSYELIEALKRLEYRGYDSAGIAILENNKINNLKAKGKIQELESLFHKSPITGHLGVGHTRWATHGIPSHNNAHPHQTEKLAVVHNGIIENFRSLRTLLEEKGYVFKTETDTEVILYLIAYYLDQDYKPQEATRLALNELEGAFAVAVIFADEPDLLIGAKNGPPLVVGYHENKIYLGSDSYALGNFTNKIVYLADEEMVEIRLNKVKYLNYKNNQAIEKTVRILNPTEQNTSKGVYKHYMLKEIFEQPEILAENLQFYIDNNKDLVNLPPLPFSLADITKITIVACGTSYYAGLTAKYWVESIAKIPVEVDIASEFRYRDVCLPNGGLTIFISQSGETADTLAALRYAKTLGQHVLSIVNVSDSSIVRESDVSLSLNAGIEIGVASTKAFTCQLLVLLLLTLETAFKKSIISQAELSHYLSILRSLPHEASLALNNIDTIVDLSKELSRYQNILYIGRGTSYPIALEGALKLKELSYIHSEAIAAGELKHGTIALIDENMAIIAIVPYDDLFTKTSSNIEEIAARGGKIVTISTELGNKSLENVIYKKVDTKDIDPLITPFIYAIITQLLAYYTALHKGTDVDQPRNLAKSVTVE